MINDHNALLLRLYDICVFAEQREHELKQFYCNVLLFEIQHKNDKY